MSSSARCSTSSDANSDWGRSEMSGRARVAEPGAEPAQAMLEISTLRRRTAGQRSGIGLSARLYSPMSECRSPRCIRAPQISSAPSASACSK